jgi:hypothetical protein
VQRGPFGENGGQGGRVETGQFGRRGLVPQPPDQVERRAEGALQRHLLVQQHADQQGERAAGQQFVGLGFHRHREGHGAPSPESRSRMPAAYSAAVLPRAAEIHTCADAL